MYSKTCQQGTLLWEDRHPVTRRCFLRNVLYLPHVKEPAIKEHLSCMDTFCGTLSCPLKTGFTIDKLIYLAGNGPGILVKLLVNNVRLKDLLDVVNARTTNSIDCLGVFMVTPSVNVNWELLTDSVGQLYIYLSIIHLNTHNTYKVNRPEVQPVFSAHSFVKKFL